MLKLIVEFVDSENKMQRRQSLINNVSFFEGFIFDKETENAIQFKTSNEIETDSFFSFSKVVKSISQFEWFNNEVALVTIAEYTE